MSNARSCTRLAAGAKHTVAVLEDSAANSWGANHVGQLGDGTTTRRLTPVNVSGLSSGVASVTAGFYHSCAVLTSTAAKCWGYNGNGQLGDGTTTNRHSPVAVSGLSSGVASITAGGYHTCAVLTSTAAVCWGQNNNGRLGDGTTTRRLTPVTVSGLSSGVASVAAGYWHTCAVLTSTAAVCWGYNNNGQLGDGTTSQRLTPVTVSGLSTP